MQNQDMSMEEILASIRRIISEDKRSTDPGGTSPSTGLGSAGAPLTQAVPENTTTSDVLDLKNRIQDDGSVRIMERGSGLSSNPISSPSVKSYPGVYPRNGFERTSAATALAPEHPPHGAFPTVPSAAAAIRPPATATTPSLAPREGGRPTATSLRGQEQEELLMSNKTATTSLESLRKVMENPQVLISSDSNCTLEEMVREALKPLLRTWMDTHLPTIVERVVREQIQLMMRQA